jgi:hypothetical protein
MKKIFHANEEVNMEKIEYILSPINQMKIKLYNYYTYPNIYVCISRLFSGPVMIILGLNLFTSEEKNNYYFFCLFLIIYGCYVFIKPLLQVLMKINYKSTLNQIIEYDNNKKEFIIRYSDVKNVISINDINKIYKIKFGYKIFIKILKEQIFITIPKKLVISGDLDSLIITLNKEKLSNCI